MCYHVATPSRTKLKQQFADKNVLYEGADQEHVSGFTRPFLPVTLNRHGDSIIGARWKLIPYWVSSEQQANKYANTLNAEGSSIFEKASYKPYILQNRGLLYIEGFYEPHYVQGKAKSQNFYLYPNQGNIITLGIVFSDFTDQESGNSYPTFSILTTEANEQVGAIHNIKKRMPLIIPSAGRQRWMDASTQEELQQLIIPYTLPLQSRRAERVTAGNNSKKISTQTIANKGGAQLPLF